MTFGAHDLVTSTRFADPLTSGIVNSELIIFDHLSHGALHEDPEAFNRATLEFLLRQSCLSRSPQNSGSPISTPSRAHARGL